MCNLLILPFEIHFGLSYLSLYGFESSSDCLPFACLFQKGVNHSEVQFDRDFLLGALC
jgi:hypothetical protein